MSQICQMYINVLYHYVLFSSFFNIHLKSQVYIVACVLLILRKNLLLIELHEHGGFRFHSFFLNIYVYGSNNTIHIMNYLKPKLSLHLILRKTVHFKNFTHSKQADGFLYVKNNHWCNIKYINDTMLLS